MSFYLDKQTNEKVEATQAQHSGSLTGAEGEMPSFKETDWIINPNDFTEKRRIVNSEDFEKQFSPINDGKPKNPWWIDQGFYK